MENLARRTKELVLDTKSYFNVSIVIYVIITCSALLQPDHQLYNLEPYPDGLLYALSARNMIIHSQLALLYNNQILPIWVSPIYSLYLAIFYCISTLPVMFVIANVFLGCISFYYFYKLLKLFIFHQIIEKVLVILYLLSFQIIWITQLPMAENLALTLFIWSLYSLFKNDNKSWFIALIPSVLFMSIKLSSVPLGLTLIGLSVYSKAIHQFSPIKVISFVSISLLLGSVLFFKQITFFIMDLFIPGGFFDTANIIQNIYFYTSVMMGLPGRFLWKTMSLLSSSISIPAIGFLCYKLYKEAKSYFIWLILVIFHFPLLLFLNVVDQRYVITLLPLLIILFGFFLHLILERFRVLAIVLIIFAFASQILSQRELLTELVSSNLFGKSTAWQYQAVKHFNQYFIDRKSSFVITALPPFLVDAYQEGSYSVLPLSNDQEFLQKKEYIWGEDIDYTNLIQSYTRLLEEGNELYISNAYITHQQSVIDDFEGYKDTFDFELVSEGCLSACNIYKITLPDTISLDDNSQ